MNFTLKETTIRDIQAAYLDGRLTCVELVQAYLDRIAAYDQSGPALNAFVKLNPAALEEAAALDRALAQTKTLVGPLHGIPVAVKDQAETKGIETRFGSVALSGLCSRKGCHHRRQDEGGRCDHPRQDRDAGFCDILVRLFVGQR